MTNLKEKVPTTLIEAIDILEKGLTPEEIKFIQGNESASLHHGAGTLLRNEWGLWKPDSPIIKDMKTRYGLFGHADDASGLLFAGLWAKVKGEDSNKALEAQAASYARHWNRSGLNPKTGEEMSNCGVCSQSIAKDQTWCQHCGANDADE